MITKRTVTVYLSESGPTTRKYHTLWAACMREAFYKLKAVYLRVMTQEEFDAFTNTPEFSAERETAALGLQDHKPRGLAGFVLRSASSSRRLPAAGPACFSPKRKSRVSPALIAVGAAVHFHPPAKENFDG